MLNSLRKKYMLAGSLLILSFLVILLLASAFFKKQMVEDWNRQKLEVLAQDAARILKKHSLEEATPRLDTLAFENNVSISVVDERFHLLSSTRLRETRLGTIRKKIRRLIRENQEELNRTGVLFYSSLNDERMTSFVQVQVVEGTGYVILRRSIRGFNSSVYVMQKCFILAAVVTVVIGLFVMFFLSGRMARPIGEINRVTRKIANLDFGERVQIRSGDELGQLGESVNVMSRRLEKALTNLRQDVENRKTLVRNMSHELKTPAAVIMGYAENMPYIAENNPKKLEKYCQVIVKECERMDSLICQMLEVSARELGNERIHVSRINLDSFRESIERGYEDEFPQHEGWIAFCLEVKEAVYGDRELLERAVYNLVKNAVRYGREDGCIQVHLWQQKERTYFSVHNEGSQIPREEQERIWDVFYKVDTSRERRENSFGVGLSIVKQTAEAHGGGVFVKNTAEGVEIGFYIRKTEKTT
ncbi:MAG: HAMP domain-containing sensor histidine kinase [Eubacteriales bacterium]|nr:HAMP domain-containing sensor histidine kinase [Eubacteriales bacterium]